MLTSNHTQNTAADDLYPRRASDDDFEFSFAVGDDSSAHEIPDSNTVYPIFGRERSSVDDNMELHSYCESVPASPDRSCKKSSSTGSASRWRLRDLVVGRSHSDGKDKFVFLAPPAGKKSTRAMTTSEAPPAVKGSMGKVTEMDMATAHRLYYGKGNSSSSAAAGGARRSFLPYKQDLVGFLGLSRSHPF